MKTFVSVLLCILILPVILPASTTVASVANGGAEENTALSEQIAYELENYDFQAWERTFKALPDEIRGMLGTSAESMVEEYALFRADGDARGIFDKLKNIFLSAVKKNTVPITKILAIGILSGLALSVTAKEKTSKEDSAVSLICMGVCILLLMNEITNATKSAAASVLALSGFLEVSMPILSTLIASVGSVGTSGMLSPLSAFLNSFVVNVFNNTVLPLTLALAAVSVINAMSDAVELNHLQKLIKTVLKWIIGLVFTVYMGMLAVQGVAVSNADSVAVKSVKFALDKSVPVVGSVVSGTLSTVISCVGMIKNAAGISAVLIAAASLAVPLLNIGGMTMALRIGAALCETVADKKICNLLSAMADVCNYLFAAVVSVGIMFMITMGICIMIGS